MAEGRRILLVDDDESVLFVLQASLLRLDFPLEVVTARDSRVALTLAQGSAFDLLVTDVRLPGLDGILLTEAICAREPQPAILWITGHGCHDIALDAQRLDVIACLEKPVEIAEFRRSVCHALGLDPHVC